MFNKKIILVVFINVFILFGCASNQTELLKTPHRDTEFLLGTVVTISIYNPDQEHVVELAIDRIEQLEHILSDEIESTEVDQIDENAGIKSVQVSEELYYVSQSGVEHGDTSDGDIDVAC